MSSITGKLKHDEFSVDLPSIPSLQVFVSDFGGRGDGEFDNSEVFQAAINECSINGGGTIIVTSGIWRTDAIIFKSHINLHLERGATIKFSDDYSDYPLITSSFEGVEAIRCQSPLDAEGLTDISISGEGVIDGSGDAWRYVKKFKLTDIEWKNLIASGGVVDPSGEMWWPTERGMNGEAIVSELKKQGITDPSQYEEARDYLRPNLLSFRNCKRVKLEGVTFQNSPAWNIHLLNCEDVHIQGVTIRNPWYSQNGDGLDLESCHRVIVTESVFDVGDDAVCLKSGKGKQARISSLPTRFVEISHCHVYSGHGAFVIGSEMSGGVSDVYLHDCSFYGTDTGLRFKSTRGRGGVIEKIDIDRINMMKVKKEAIIFDMFYEKTDGKTLEKASVSEETPIFRSIKITNVTSIDSERAIVLYGLPEMPLEDLTFENIKIKSKKGLIANSCKKLIFKNCQINSRETKEADFIDCFDLVIDSSVIE
ncbi:glycoside hydrolase family 28 protein [Salipaludibacillus sp. HK11]|uniref:glycoside hydrolase family 28 protein n=1 Tax=Salipaludibacillus sp. HK11 TaxID=3394320 RepID=UPI0039FCB083